MTVVGAHPTDEDSCPVCGGAIVRVCRNELARVASVNNARLDAVTLEARWLRANLYEARNPYRVVLPYTQDGLLYRWTGEKYEPFPIGFEGWDVNEVEG